MDKDMYVVKNMYGDCFYVFDTEELANKFIEDTMEHCCKYYNARRTHAKNLYELRIEKVIYKQNANVICEPKRNNGYTEEQLNTTRKYCSNVREWGECFTCKIQKSESESDSETE